MIYLVTKNKSARLTYVLELIFQELLGIDYVIVDEPKPKAINLYYGISEGFSVPDIGLLWQEGVNKQLTINPIGLWHEEPVFFTKAGFSLPFDLFSAVFYLVSRYEEYPPHDQDIHHRFPPTASVLVQQNWIKKPLVNLWVNLLLAELLRLDPHLKYKKRRFEFIPTLDIDMAWKYKHKGFLRHIGSLLADVFLMKKAKLIERWQLLRGEADPFYNFDYQRQIHKKYNANPVYFILLGKHGKFDKNTSTRNLTFRQLIRQIDSYAQLGIHPSYYAQTDIKQLKHEFNTFKQITGRPAKANRQHFLMHQMPATYQQLIALGIQEDYTMGYTSYSGFRAGIAAPFYWYDLENEKKTSLKIIPFCHMDITPMHYENITIEQAKNELSLFMRDIAACGGLFSILWHNESLSNSEQWKGWHQLYAHSLAEADQLIANYEL